MTASYAMTVKTGETALVLLTLRVALQSLATL